MDELDRLILDGEQLVADLAVLTARGRQLARLRAKDGRRLGPGVRARLAKLARRLEAAESAARALAGPRTVVH